MDTILGITQVLLSIAMIAIILVQRGPGAAAGSGFGAGASGTVFGARGAGSFLTRTTAALATAFFLISMGMAVMASRNTITDAAPDLGVMAGAVEGSAGQDVPPAPQLEPVSDVPEITIPQAADDAVVPALPQQETEEDPEGN